ncbi:MAG TPA: hypothetical protein VH916_01990 [Dehalococcoidia bacterium]|jgi:hypothetical protein
MPQTKLQPLSDLLRRWLLPLAITVLTLADGLLHLRLDYLLFNGTLWGSARPGGGHPPGPPPGASGPPPGAAGPPSGHLPGNPFPFSLNEMFFLNFLAAIGLVLAFWIAYRWLPRWLLLVDAAIAGFAGYSIWGWWDVGKPNPQNLGHISKAIEVALLLLLAVHAWLLLKRRGADGRTRPSLIHNAPSL